MKRTGTTCFAAFAFAMAMGAEPALAHDVDSASGNSLGSCASFGNSIAEAVWSWCYSNDRKNMNKCKASERPWVDRMESKCKSVSRKHGCRPDRYDAVTWHVHGTGSGQQLGVHYGVLTSCD